LIPLLTLVAGALCLVGYVALTINEQRQEFGILRAVGARSRTVLAIMSGQNIIISLSSFGAGVAVGLMLSLLLLIQQPVITVYGAMEIAVELLAILFAVFAFSLFPTVRFARKPVLEIIREP
jgi:putative ABC transport system permease protein